MQHTDLTENPSTKGRTSVPEKCACWCSHSVCQVYGGWAASAAMLCASMSVCREPVMAPGSSVFSKGQEYLKVCIYLIFSRDRLVFSAEMEFRPQAEVRKDPSETCSLC